MLAGIAPSALEFVFMWRIEVFLTMTFVGSFLAGWGLFRSDRLSAMMTFGAFFILNLIVGLMIGCSKVS